MDGQTYSEVKGLKFSCYLYSSPKGQNYEGNISTARIGKIHNLLSERFVIFLLMLIRKISLTTEPGFQTQNYPVVLQPTFDR
ncbi:MAG: hypothetical protein AB7S72_19535 [Draconibacterium sp.]|jgi:hypothetical protein